MIDIKEEFKKYYKKISKDRYKKIGDYKLDRFIFKGSMYLIFAFLFFVAFAHNFSLDYFYCPEDSDGSIQGSRLMLSDHKVEAKPGFCKNPFYKNTWKNQEYVTPGHYGTQPTTLFKSINFIVIGVLGLAILINHLINNRRGGKSENIFN